MSPHRPLRGREESIGLSPLFVSTASAPVSRTELAQVKQRFRSVFAWRKSALMRILVLLLRGAARIRAENHILRGGGEARPVLAVTAAVVRFIERSERLDGSSGTIRPGQSPEGMVKIYSRNLRHWIQSVFLNFRINPLPVPRSTNQ